MYKNIKELEKNSLIITMEDTNKNADLATKWLSDGRKVYCIRRNSHGIVINFYPEKIKEAKDRDLKSVHYLIWALAEITCSVPEKIIDMLTGYLWNEEEAGKLKD